MNFRSLLSTTVCYLSLSAAAFANQINVVTLDGSRINYTPSAGAAPVDFSFTSDRYAAVRNDLLNTGFYNNGVSSSVNITSVSELNATTLANADVVIMAYQNCIMTLDEMNALNGFVTAGGGLLGFGDDVAHTYALSPFTSSFLVTQGGVSTSGVATATASSTNPITNGAFGTYTGSVSTGQASAFDTYELNASVALTNDQGAFAASFEIDQGRAALFNDDEIFSDDPTYWSALYGDDEQGIFMNAFCYVSQHDCVGNAHPAPEPGSLALMALGLAGCVRLRKSA